MEKLIYQDKVSASFISKLKLVADQLNVNPNWLMAIINFESAGTFSPSIKNPFGYVGLIQFGKSAAQRIGTTVEDLENMTAEQQLDYVYLYYKPYKRKIKNYIDLYLATLFPVAIGKPSNYVLQTRHLPAERVAKANPIFDINKDHKITVQEIETKLLKHIPGGWRKVFVKKKATC
ncbi:hypothetical protein CXF68_12360 [Tenacibaculum sp. Bg11-29]|uniref:transglycosylase SLT domain-containing protein n=1 Tax=Tenacibaculum sp. Bg11-29 TaxID=2058306 RepID=UPI000C33D375|nr:transglycosylase SLT domain-containing protein [Tenacibaculum sp. Bg11-29]PKH51425.1 hypothetical protein CXF68_12360 [Tenacibaculum sp. Bg11-29]